MNKDNAHLYLPLVQALADGKLQMRISGGDWISVGPEQHIEFVYAPDQYRIKPEPREWWVIESKPGALWWFGDNREAVQFGSEQNIKPIHVREVLP